MKIEDTFYKELLDNLYDGVYFVDKNRKISYWNRGAERITGYKGSEVVGKHCFDNMLMHSDENGVILCHGNCPLAATIGDGQQREAEVSLHHKDGHRVPVLLRVSPIKDPHGNIIGAVEVFSDNSSKIAAIRRVQELQGIAFLDALTGVGNRRYTEISLRSRLSELNRYSWSFGVLFIDIDHFKAINDAYGHNMGDEVLKMVARTLESSLRSFDFLGRWGGEEFVAIISNVNEEQLYSIANRCRALVQQSSLFFGSGCTRATVSIGATLARPDDNISTLIKRADELMYQSKVRGRNRVSVKLGA